MTDAKLDALALKFQSVTPGTPLADRERGRLHDEITEILIRECHICMQDETEAAACADAIKSVLKNYSPDKGEFLHYFRKTYFWRKKDRDNSTQYMKCHIRTKKKDIPAYDAPQDGARPLLLLRPNYEYYVYSALPEYKNPEYFKLRLHVPGDTQKTRTVYVKYTSDVEVYFYNEFLNIYEDEDGNEINRDIKDKDGRDKPEEKIITREMIQWALQLNLLVFLKFHEQKTLDTKVLTRPGKLTQYDCLRMFFTEDMIAILHSTAESFGEETTDRETMSMDLCDRGWLTFLLTEPCSSFREISVTPVNTYDHFLHNGREKPVKLPPVLSIRGKYIREGMGVNRTDYSLKSEIWKHHKEYKERMNEGRTEWWT